MSKNHVTTDRFIKPTRTTRNFLWESFMELFKLLLNLLNHCLTYRYVR